MTQLATLNAPLETVLQGTVGDTSYRITIRSKDAAHLESQLQEIEHGSALTTLGRVTKAAETDVALGYHLSATDTSPQPQSDTFTPPAAQTVVVNVTEAAPAAAPAPAPTPEPVAAAAGPAFTGAPEGHQPPQPPAPPAGAPGAPLTPFGPAILLQSAPGAPTRWMAWADPRPADQIAHLATPEFFTDNPQDPELQAGTKKFMQRIPV